MVRQLAAVCIAGALAVGACQSVPPSSPAPASPTASAFVPPRDTVTPDALASCESPWPTPQPTGPEIIDLGGGYAPTDGPDGGTLIVGDRHPVSEFNPINVVAPADQQLARATWAGVAGRTGELQVAPDLSRDPLPSIENGLVQLPGTDGFAMTVTWCLRPDLRWSDGTPLTCDDFEFARQWVHDVATPAVRARYGDLQAIRCPGSDVLMAEYGSPFSDFYTELVPPLPRHSLHALTLDERRAGVGFRPGDLPTLPVSGPFAFASVTPNEVRLVRNPYYVGGFRGRPAHLDAVTFRQYPSDAAIIDAFKSGEVDIGANLDQTDIAELQVPGLEEHVSAVPSMVEDALVPNWSATAGSDGSGGCSLARAIQSRGAGCPAADPAIRAAIARAIDSEAVAKALTGLESPALGALVIPDMYYFIDAARPPFDLNAARHNLEAAGWVASIDGSRSKGDLRARLELCTQDGGRWPAAAALVASELGAVGIDAVIHVVPLAELLAPFASAKRTSPCAISRSNFDLALEPVSGSIEPIGYWLRFHSSAFEPNGRNDARVSDPLIDTALDQAIGDVDFVVIKHAMAAFQQAAADASVELPLTFQPTFYLVTDSRDYKAFRNFYQGVAVPITWNAADWLFGG